MKERRLGTERRREETIPAMTNKAQVLQQDLWGRLPSELIDQVLARLPFSRLLPFCYVCRRWQKFILSSRAHSLFLFLGDELVIRNLNTGGTGGTGAWEHLSLQFLGLPAEQFKSLLLVASGGGLVCFSYDRGADFQEYVVCNPLTRSFQKVPPSPIAVEGSHNLLLHPDNRLMVTMLTETTENSTEHFKLVLCFLLLRSTITPVCFVYCSRDCSWAKTAEYPEALKQCFAKFNGFESRGVEHLGSVYWAFSIYHGSGKYGCFLVKYNVVLNHWSWLNPQIIECRRRFCIHAILPYAGKLFFLHGNGERHEQFEIVLKEPDSSHALALEAETMSLSPRSFCENMFLKFLPRIDDSIQFQAFCAKAPFPTGQDIFIKLACYGDGGPVMYYVGIATLIGNCNGEEMIKTSCFDEGERFKLIVGMEEKSRLVTSDFEKWAKEGLAGFGGVLTPTP